MGKSEKMWMSGRAVECGGLGIEGKAEDERSEAEDKTVERASALRWESLRRCG